MSWTLIGSALAAPLALGTVLLVAAPAHAAQNPAPDVRVTYVARAADSPRTTYTFLVSNVGDGPADPIRLTHATSQERPGRSSVAREQTSSGATIVTLAPRESMTLAVVCDPEPGLRCAGAELRAATPNDRDTRDNADASR